MRKLIHRLGSVAALAAAGLVVACNGRSLTPGTPDAGATPEPVTSTTPSPDVAIVAPETPPVAVGRDCANSTYCSWWQDPDPGLICCDGFCENTHDGPWNCGACGAECDAGQICVEGKCRAPIVPAAPAPGATDATVNLTASLRQDCTVIACAGGQICCGGECVAPSWDGKNCGGCGVACRFEGSGCAFGVCCPAETPNAACHTRTCPDGQVFCDPGCKDLSVDPDNCGACGAVCPAALRTCVSGVCLAA